MQNEDIDPISKLNTVDPSEIVSIRRPKRKQRAVSMIRIVPEGEQGMDFTLMENAPADILGCWFIEEAVGVHSTSKKQNSRMLPILAVDSDPELPVVTRHFCMIPGQAIVEIEEGFKLKAIGAYQCGTKVIGLFEKIKEE